MTMDSSPIAPPIADATLSSAPIDQLHLPAPKSASSVTSQSQPTHRAVDHIRAAGTHEKPDALHEFAQNAQSEMIGGAVAVGRGIQSSAPEISKIATQVASTAGRAALDAGGVAVGGAAIVLTTPSAGGENSSSIRMYANPDELNFAAHPPQSSTTVLPNDSQNTSLGTSVSPAGAGPTSITHTGHDQALPRTSPIHTTPSDTSAAGRSVTTTPIHRSSAADQMNEARKLLPTGANHQGEFNGTLESAFTIQRVGELKEQVGRSASFGTTMGVAVASDADGNRFVLVSSNELKEDGSPRLRKGVTLNSGEIAAGGNPRATNHDAETNIANYATAHGLTLIDAASTRPVCGDCEKIMTDQSPNVHISSPRTGQSSISRQSS